MSFLVDCCSLIGSCKVVLLPLWGAREIANFLLKNIARKIQLPRYRQYVLALRTFEKITYSKNLFLELRDRLVERFTGWQT